MTELALYLRKARHAQGWSQAYVGAQIGVSGRAIGKWEAGQGQPGLVAARRLAILYRTDGRVNTLSRLADRQATL